MNNEKLITRTCASCHILSAMWRCSAQVWATFHWLSGSDSDFLRRVHNLICLETGTLVPTGVGIKEAERGAFSQGRLRTCRRRQTCSGPWCRTAWPLPRSAASAPTPSGGAPSVPFGPSLAPNFLWSLPCTKLCRRRHTHEHVMTLKMDLLAHCAEIDVMAAAHHA